MAKGKSSGYVLKPSDAPIIMGMVARGDRDHDIAGWFGVNQGRIAEVKDGSKFGHVASAPSAQLPPSGPPGIKGRRLRASLEAVLNHLQAGKSDAATDALEKAMARYDANEA